MVTIQLVRFEFLWAHLQHLLQQQGKGELSHLAGCSTWAPSTYPKAKLCPLSSPPPRALLASWTSDMKYLGDLMCFWGLNSSPFLQVEIQKEEERESCWNTHLLLRREETNHIHLKVINCLYWRKTRSHRSHCHYDRNLDMCT